MRGAEGCSSIYINIIHDVGCGMCEKKDYMSIMFGVSDAEFEELFVNKKLKSDSLYVEAYKRAHEVRKFEIELYWTRALYFWGFEAAFFVVFAAVMDVSSLSAARYYLLAVVSMFGTAFTYLWRLALYGTKQWQENWELHIDFLEKYVSGNLYKTVMFKNGSKDKFYSVSRINLGVNFIVFIFWTLLCLASLFKILQKDYFLCVPFEVKYVYSFGVFGLFVFLLFTIWTLKNGKIKKRYRTNFDGFSEAVVSGSKSRCVNRSN